MFYISQKKYQGWTKSDFFDIIIVNYPPSHKATEGEETKTKICKIYTRSFSLKFYYWSYRFCELRNEKRKARFAGLSLIHIPSLWATEIIIIPLRAFGSDPLGVFYFMESNKIRKENMKNNNKQTIDQIMEIMEDFRAKVAIARSEYRAKIAAILKRIDEQKLKEIREKLK